MSCKVSCLSGGIHRWGRHLGASGFEPTHISQTQFFFLFGMIPSYDRWSPVLLSPPFSSSFCVTHHTSDWLSYMYKHTSIPCHHNYLAHAGIILLLYFPFLWSVAVLSFGGARWWLFLGIENRTGLFLKKKKSFYFICCWSLGLLETRHSTRVLLFVVPSCSPFVFWKRRNQGLFGLVTTTTATTVAAVATDVLVCVVCDAESRVLARTRFPC